MIRQLAVLGAALMLAGCGGDDGPSAACIVLSEANGAFCEEENPLTTGLQTIESGELERVFYLQLPSDYETAREPKPLVLAYHGTGGSYEAWRDGTYDLANAVGDEAIMVFMQATPDQNDVNQWNYDFDLQYFEDVLDRIGRGVRYDRNRIFVTGHSSGAGMAMDIGCNYGDIVRAIAPHSGILKSFECIGSVAVLQTHGRNDTLVPAGTGEPGHQLWVAYNGFTLETFVEGVHPSCIDHSLGASPYPVQWCLHDELAGPLGHDWPSFASQATWEFFSGLPDAEPTPEPPAGGGNTTSQPDTTATFTLEFPAGDYAVRQGAVSIYAPGTQQPVTGGPQSILNIGFDTGDAGPGDVRSYEVPIKYTLETFPGTYSFSIIIYVVGGGDPIPEPGEDMLAFQDVDVVDRNTPVVIQTPFVLEPVFF